MLTRLRTLTLRLLAHTLTRPRMPTQPQELQRTRTRLQDTHTHLQARTPHQQARTPTRVHPTPRLPLMRIHPRQAVMHIQAQEAMRHRAATLTPRRPAHT